MNTPRSEGARERERAGAKQPKLDLTFISFAFSSCSCPVVVPLIVVLFVVVILGTPVVVVAVVVVIIIPIVAAAVLCCLTCGTERKFSKFSNKCSKSKINKTQSNLELGAPKNYTDFPSHLRPSLSHRNCVCLALHCENIKV